MIVDLTSPAGQVVRAAVPAGCKLFLGHKFYRRQFHRYLQRSFGARCRLGDTGPMAPPELVTTEALMREGDLMTRSRPDWYFGSGFRDALRVLMMLERNGLRVADLKSVMEFGCGSARVLRHFRNISGLNLYGIDANRTPVERGQRNLPGIDFRPNRLEPPTDFDTGSTDVVYALSVFHTHPPAMAAILARGTMARSAPLRLSAVHSDQRRLCRRTTRYAKAAGVESNRRGDARRRGGPRVLFKPRVGLVGRISDQRRGTPYLLLGIRYPRIYEEAFWPGHSRSAQRLRRPQENRQQNW